MRELHATVASDELTYWQAFDAIEPLGGRAADHRAGVLAAVLANAHRRENAPAFAPGDFFPSLAPPPPPTLSADEEVEAFDRLVGLA